MSTMDHAGWVIVAGIVLALISGLVGRWTGQGQCKSCGIDKLRSEIRVLCGLVRILCEKAGITVERQIELEGDLAEKEGAK